MRNADTRRKGTLRWRKRLTRGVVCVLLGAVTTVGVAWGLALPEHTTRARTTADLDAVAWATRVPDSWPDLETPRQYDGALVDYGTTFSVRRLYVWDETLGSWDERERRSWDEIVYTCGWPAPAVHGWEHLELVWPPGAICEPIAFETRHYLLRAAGDRPLPAAPLMPGFAVNVVFYALPWWLLLVTPGLIKRKRRRRRGRCIACGYDLAGLAVENGVRTCPECGEIARSDAPA